MVKVWKGLHFNIFGYIILHYKFMTPFVIRAKMNHFCVLLFIVNALVQIDVTTMLLAKVMLNRNERGHKESDSLHLKNRTL